MLFAATKTLLCACFAVSLAGLDSPAWRVRESATRSLTATAAGRLAAWSAASDTTSAEVRHRGRRASESVHRRIEGTVAVVAVLWPLSEVTMPALENRCRFVRTDAARAAVARAASVVCGRPVLTGFDPDLYETNRTCQTFEEVLTISEEGTVIQLQETFREKRK